MRPRSTWTARVYASWARSTSSSSLVKIEVGSTGEVVTESARLKRAGFELRHEDGVTCCYAVQDKFWVTGADRREWEVYTRLADAPTSVQSPAPQGGNGSACCPS